MERYLLLPALFMLARKGHRSFSFSFFFSFLWGPGFLRPWILRLPLSVVSLSLKRSLDSYQSTPNLHEAPEQDSQNPKSPLQSAGALFNLRV
jgi:hypothetical protein